MRRLTLFGLCLALLGGAPPAQAHEPATSSGVVEWTPADEQRLSPHHARSFLEMGGGLALGASAYWIFQDRNVADWDNPRPEERFQAAAWILDNNSLFVNYLGHPLTGGLSYSFARANHHGVLMSTGYSFVTSFLWEFVLEFKEKVSINDVIVTPGAGLPIGEFVYKLGLYLNTGAGASTAVDVARWTLGTGVALDRSWDGRGAPPVRRRDNLGFSRAIWHEFVAKYGVAAVTTPQRDDYARYRVGMSGRLVTLPGYLSARSFGRPFHGADISDLSLEVEASRYGAGVLMNADTMLVGYHAQQLERAGTGLRGVAVTVGSSIGFGYLKSSANRYHQVERAVAQQPQPKVSYHVPQRAEQWGAFNMPGVAVDFRAQGGVAAFTLSGRTAPSFGSVGAAAFYDFTAANSGEKSKHILHRQGYFYGWGVASSLNARLSLGPWRAGFELGYATYASQDGWDRHMEQLTVDVPAQGDVLSYRTSLGVEPGGRGVSLGLDWGVRRFHSQVGGFERTARSVERGISARWAF
jgi:hypothetical protein